MPSGGRGDLVIGLLARSAVLALSRVVRMRSMASLAVAAERGVV
jgi:hypothetical protein